MSLWSMVASRMAAGSCSQSEAARVMSVNTTAISPSGGAPPLLPPLPLPLMAGARPTTDEALDEDTDPVPADVEPPDMEIPDDVVVIDVPPMLVCSPAMADRRVMT